MRHRVSGRHLGRDTAHRTALYRNLITDLLRHERITTTEAKAKEIRPMAEKIITLAKRGDLHARRQAMKVVYDPKVVKRTFDVIAPRMAGRPGGYLRITGLEPRKGDGARMAVIELVDVTEAPPTPRPRRVTTPPVPSRAATPAGAAAAPQLAPEEPAGEDVAAVAAVGAEPTEAAEGVQLESSEASVADSPNDEAGSDEEPAPAEEEDEEQQ